LARAIGSLRPELSLHDWAQERLVTVPAPSHFVAGPLFGIAGALYTALDLRHITEGQMVMDASGHYVRPDLFTLLVDDRPQVNVSFRFEGGRDTG